MRTLKDSLVVVGGFCVRIQYGVLLLGQASHKAAFEKQKYTCCKNGVVEPLLSCGT